MCIFKRIEQELKLLYPDFDFTLLLGNNFFKNGTIRVKFTKKIHN